ncbi:Uncharacterized membrane protein [Prosthecobacter debontii]|uniref:Uncharacterized membrane protein n=1 Tax=Prosthecobacter debontii TaxID=48467 RepID=A0A1T4WUC2_9BACT|nr:DUF2254 domain-containing protein [Prosthecobacter debontii]SKA80231.1 Uncharacterized membrane protein [Prosthecobacter debontii]
MLKWRYLLMQLRTRLWIKPALTGLAATVWIETAFIASNWRMRPPFEIDRELMLSLLQILASTMLTVAIFAVTAMVGAYASVTTTATPRASRLVMQDRSSQNTLAAFLSAFIYAIVALVALSAIPYGGLGRFFLFVGYVGIVVWVLVSFIRWVDQVSKLGRVHDTIQRVETAALEAFTDPILAGTLGGKPASLSTGDNHAKSLVIHTPKIGYLQFVDMEALQGVAEECKSTLRLEVRPGAFLDRCRPLLIVQGITSLDDELKERLVRAFTLGVERHVESDPRFGLVMLAEIADRALSPGINDPGTAIAVIGSQVRLLSQWADATRELDQAKVQFPKIEVPPLDAEDLLDDAFTPIARDGAAMFEVGMRLQKAFRSLQSLEHPLLAQAARHHAQLALHQALDKVPTGYHRDKLRAFAESSQRINNLGKL